MAKFTKALMVTGFLVTLLGSGASLLAASFSVGRVEAFDTDSWTSTPANRSFRVVVDGDGDTDLDLFIYDAVTGRFLGSDDDLTDYCIVRGRSDSGRIRIEIKNLGDVWNRYTLSVD